MTSRRARDIAALLVVLTVAALFRFYRLDAVEFFHDEAMVSMMAQEMADGRTFPLQGILSSVGIPNPPTSIYVMALPFAFSSDPVVATGYVALLNVLGVGLLWAIARKEFGFAAALVAGLLFACNPWAVLYSRKVWAQDYVNPFLLLALTAAIWGFKDGKRWGQILAFPLMLFAMQIHFAAWALAPLFAWIGWSGRQNIRRTALLVGLLLGALVMLPYAVGLAQTLQADPARISDALARSGGARDSGLAGPQYAVELALGTAIERWAAPHVAPETFAQFFPWMSIGAIVTGVMMIAGAAATAVGYLWRAGFVLWILVPIAAFQIGLADIWPHYFVPQMPAFALLAGIGASAVTNFGKRQARSIPRLAGVVSLAVLGVMAAQFVYYAGIMSYAYYHDIEFGEGTSGYTTPAYILSQVRDAIPLDIDDVIVLTDGDRVWFDAEAARWPVILHDRTACVRTLAGENNTLIPASRYAVIVTPTASKSLRDFYAGGDSTVIPGRAGEGDYVVSVHDSTRQPDAQIALFANGISLASWEDEDEGFKLSFRLPEAPDRTFYGALNYDYQYFVHLLDADGNRIGQTDASFWPGRHWCANDDLTLTVQVAGVTEAHTLRFGFYQLIDAELGSTRPVDVLDVAGNAAGNWVDIVLDGG